MARYVCLGPIILRSAYVYLHLEAYVDYQVGFREFKVTM